MNLKEARELYKKCNCNGFSVYAEYGEDVSKAFEALATDRLRKYGIT